MFTMYWGINAIPRLSAAVLALETVCRLHGSTYTRAQSQNVILEARGMSLIFRELLCVRGILDKCLCELGSCFVNQC